MLTVFQYVDPTGDTAQRYAVSKADSPYKKQDNKFYFDWTIRIFGDGAVPPLYLGTSLRNGGEPVSIAAIPRPEDRTPMTPAQTEERTMLKETTDALVRDLEGFIFAPPVSHVYNPLVYARVPYDLYLDRFGAAPKEVVFIGMNPGPWGMAQTGVPFGEVGSVQDWLGIGGFIGKPTDEHPKRPVLGLDCPRSEASGKRVWGWARSRFATTERFFGRFFIANYCPLLFLEESGRNRTPDRLPAAERRPLLDACDRALRRTVEHLEPRRVIGFGRFAEARAREALAGLDVKIDSVLHPSPANPRANRGWAEQVDEALSAMGVRI